jgi:hypothetical protein
MLYVLLVCSMRSACPAHLITVNTTNHAVPRTLSSVHLSLPPSKHHTTRSPHPLGPHTLLTARHIQALCTTRARNKVAC